MPFNAAFFVSPFESLQAVMTSAAVSRRLVSCLDPLNPTFMLFFCLDIFAKTLRYDAMLRCYATVLRYNVTLC